MFALDNLKKLIEEIVSEARSLSEKCTNERDLPVNYACIFTQSESEYEELLSLARQLGTVVQETAMGPVLHMVPLATVAGDLRLLKIRRPDPKRRERGDADFTLSNYQQFKDAHMGTSGFNLIQRENMEMIELIDPSFNVLVYYSHPTLAETLKIDF